MSINSRPSFTRFFQILSHLSPLHPLSKRSAVAVCAVSSLALLGGCASTNGGQSDDDHSERLKPGNVEVEANQKKLAKSAQVPLYDLNLKRDEIPATLSGIEVVYGYPSDEECAKILAEVQQLSEALGPDPSLKELSQEVAAANNNKSYKYKLKTSDALEDTISGYIPYSSIIRRLSGAEKHKRKLAATIVRGQLRRSYLTGIAREKGCVIPLPELELYDEK